MSTKKKKCWSESFGYYGSKIRLAERERGGILYLLWVDKTGKQQKRSLGHRDREQGRRQAIALANQLASGVAPEARAEPLTLKDGVARALDPVRGMYPTETRHVKEARRLAERALEVLGERLTWEQLTPARIQHLTRVLARRSRQGEGVRTVEYMCDVLYGVAGWLRDEGLIPDAAALPRRNWKVRLKQEWQAITGRVPQVERPRHSVEEVARIFAALPQADPRIRLLIELSAELRAGQAVRARRSDLVLEPVGGFGLGRFTVHGRGKKHGEVVDLHPELRALVDEVLTTGYLADAEAALRRGEIEDYFLFPIHRLKEGRAKVEWCVKAPLGEKSIRDMFHQLERLAGVEPRKGRAFYGLRRQATDLAPEFEQDARVLNRLTGHQDSATREQIYQDQQNERVRAQAARARRSMRDYLRQEGGGGSTEAGGREELSQSYPTPPPGSEKAPQRKPLQGLRLL